MAADGLTTRQIAVALNISTQRVNNIKAKIRAAEQEQQEAAS
jgi:DNA-binding CsgD family transcriptional regulator